MAQKILSELPKRPEEVCCHAHSIIHDVDSTLKDALVKAQARYDRGVAALEILKRDEHVRSVKVQLLLLKEELSALNEQLWNEEERRADLEWEVEELQAQAEDDYATSERMRDDMNVRTRELDVLRVCHRSPVRSTIDAS